MLINKTNFYELEVNAAKNRIYLKVKGMWKNPTDVSGYVNDITKATQNVKRNFDIVADLIEMKIGSQEVIKVHEAAQKVLMDAGLNRTAEILPQSAILQMHADEFSKKSGMKKQVFKNKVDADKWLD